MTVFVPSRRVVLRGPQNFRDLGGYLTHAGEIVRWRQVFRSDALSALDPADDALLRHELGGPVLLDVGLAAPSVDGPGGDALCVVLRRSAPTLAGLLDRVAATTRPVVLHGGAGRDRVGVAAAVLLGVLGVTEADIARDYALSPGADARTMHSVLRSLRRDHGSVAGYAIDAGLDVGVIEALRDRLLH